MSFCPLEAPLFNSTFSSGLIPKAVPESCVHAVSYVPPFQSGENGVLTLHYSAGKCFLNAGGEFFREPFAPCIRASVLSPSHRRVELVTIRLRQWTSLKSRIHLPFFDLTDVPVEFLALVGKRAEQEAFPAFRSPMTNQGVRCEPASR